MKTIFSRLLTRCARQARNARVSVGSLFGRFFQRTSGAALCSFLLIAALLGMRPLQVGAAESAPGYGLVLTAGGSGNDGGASVAFGSDGTLYMTGYFQGTATFGASTMTSSGGDNTFLVAYSPAGQVLWKTAIGGANLRPRSVVVGPDGGVYVLVEYTAVGGYFVDKYDSSGALLWRWNAAGPGVVGGSAVYTWPRALTVDKNGDIYVALQQAIGGGGDRYNIYVAKVNAQRVPVWERVFGDGSYDNNPTALSVDLDLNCFVSYWTKGVNFVAKYDMAGTLQWSTRTGARSPPVMRVVADGAGGLFFGGYFSSFESGFPVSAGDTDIFVGRCSTTGEIAWLKPFPGDSADYLGGLTRDADGNLLVVGFFRGSLSMAATTLTSAGGSDVFVAKVDVQGNALWATRLGGVGDDMGEWVAADGRGNFAVTGSFAGTATMGTSTRMSAGGTDAFLVRSPGTLSIYQQPQSRTATVGAAVTLSVISAGAEPLTYQWRRNGSPISGETRSSMAVPFLNFAGLQFVQSGQYSVVITNPFGSITSENATVIVDDAADRDGDGVPDWWEALNGLSYTDPLDVDLKISGSEMTFRMKYLLGLDPLVPDSDGDGASDANEFFVHGTDPRKSDTDNDGMPDKWEIDHGLNPLVNDAAADFDGDGLSNLEEFNAGTNPRLAHTNLADGFGSDHGKVKGGPFSRHSYDRNDRLIATYYDNGAWESWRYDGNSNIRGHVLKTVRDADGDGLPDAWELAYRLSPLASTGAADRHGMNGDTDGDGWTNYQEYLAGTSPIDANDRPPAASAVGGAWSTPPKARILPAAGINGLGHLSVRIWDAEASAVQIVMQWFDPVALQWKPATILRVNDRPGTGASLVSSSAGTTHDFLWNARANLAVGFSGIVQLRVTAQDVAGTTISEAVPVAVTVATGADTDGDGLPDAWETANGLNPNDATGANGADGDLDGDGSSNLQEFLNGTLPNNAASAKFAITVAGVGAAVTKAPNQTLHDKGTSVVLTAALFPGLSNVVWTGGGVGAVAVGNTLSVVADANKTVTAYGGLSLGEALDQPTLAWTIGGAGAWFGQTEMVQDGVDAAESTLLTNAGDDAWVETILTTAGPGTLAWRWKTQFAAGGFSAFSLAVNGTVVDTVAATADWTLRTTALTGTGPKTLRWRFVRTTASAAANEDRVWVDTVVFTPEPTVPTITTPPQSQTASLGQTVTFSVVAAGTAPLSYQWKKGTAPLEGATNPSFTIGNVQTGDAGGYSVTVSNAGGSATSATATLMVTGANTAPTISDIASQAITAGGTTGPLVFTVGDAQTPPGALTLSAGSSNLALVPLPNIVFGGTGANRIVTVTPVPGQSGTATITVTVGDGALTASDSFVLTVFPVQTAPTILTPPPNRYAGIGTGTIFPVVAGGQSPLSYQWKKNNVALADDGRITGTTTATLSIGNLALADTASYSLSVSNSVGSASTSSVDGNLIVIDARPTHAVVGTGYVAGGTVTITNSLTYAGATTGFGWSVNLPGGWSYASGGGGEGDVKPAVGTMGLVEWSWTNIPASPLTFTYTLNVPSGTTGDQAIITLVTYRRADFTGPADILAKPTPLVISAAISRHSADTDADGKIGLVELTRVIELYNTRIGTTRTGAYAVALSTTEDGFEIDPTRASGAVVTLARYHSADTTRDARIGLVELTRVIELYNTRAGTTRTGSYQVQAGTEDGFAPRP